MYASSKTLQLGCNNRRQSVLKQKKPKMKMLNLVYLVWCGLDIVRSFNINCTLFKSKKNPYLFVTCMLSFFTFEDLNIKNKEYKYTSCIS